MSLFEYISIAFSMILAIGVTRLLNAMLELLRHRKQVRWHWIPLTWAFLILILLFQYWWQIFPFNDWLEAMDRNWRNVDYLIMVVYTLSIFSAASLILPIDIDRNETLDLWTHFQEEGKLALWAIIAYGACGPLTVIVVFDQALTSISTMANFATFLVIAIPALGILLSDSKRAASAWTLFSIALGLALWVLTVRPQH